MVLSSLRAADPYLLSNCYCSNTDWAEHINLLPFHPHICCAVCFSPPPCPPIIAYQDVLGTRYRLRAHVPNLFYAAPMCTFHHAPTQWHRWHRRKHCLHARASRLGLRSVGITTSMARPRAALLAPVWLHYPLRAFKAVQNLC